MSKKFLKIGLGLLVVAGLLDLAHAAAPGQKLKKLPSHAADVVSRLTPLGQVSGTNVLHLAIGLPLRNQAYLDLLLQQIYDPSSANYHHYLTSSEFTALFAPTESDYAAVKNFAATNGLVVTHTHGNRMLLDVAGKVSDLERAFHVTMKRYHHPSENRDFYAPSEDPTVDENLPVLAVQGMNNYQQPRPLLNRMPASGISPAAGSAPNGGYIGQDFRNAYLPGSSLRGSGQIVGLLQFDGYFASDIATYMSIAGLTNVPLENVLLDGFNGIPGANNDEVCLDIETSIAMAPSLSKVVVFEAGPFGNPNDLLAAMASRSEIKQFSASWGYPTDATSVQLYQQMALQGQTFLNASGDGDAWLGPIPYGSCESPYITIIGGTTLTMNGLGASYVSEKVWNWGFAGGYNWNPDGYVGSSGGISTTVPIPSWQQGINMTTNHGSTVFRNVPDVALTADNVFVVSSGGSQGSFGGTSCASPLWAGFMALINEQAVANGKPPVGFLAPAVYAIAKTVNYTNCFYDTTVGDNTWDLSLTNFFATPGYDLCTGLGTPRGTNLINALVGINAPIAPPVIISAPLPPWGTQLATMNGSNPNGLWFLFIQDDMQNDVGMITNGWFITLTTANPVGNQADNQLYSTPAVASVATNSFWTVTLAVTNYGPSFSTNVFVSDTLSVGDVTLVSNNPTAGSVQIIGSLLTWTVGNLPINTGASMKLTFLASAPGSFTNEARVYATTTDPNPDDDSVIATLTVPSVVPAPQLTAISTGTGGFQLSVTGFAGQSAIVQASTNLVTWVPVYTNLIPFTYTNLESTNFPMRFYRTVQ